MNGTSTAVGTFSEAVDRATLSDCSRTWRRVTLSAAACITLLDAALLQRKHAIFTGGFLSGNQLGTFADGVAFVLMAALLNTTIAAALSVVALAAGRRLHLRPLALRFAAFAAAVVPLAAADFVSYQVWMYLGDAFDFNLLYNLTGRRISEFFAVSAPLMSRPAVLVLVAVCAVAALTYGVHLIDRRPARTVLMPTPAIVLQRCVTLALMSSVAVVTVSTMSESMGFALRWTPSGQLFVGVLNRLSDLDRDGHGLLRNPRDPAPLDATIHPYAIDVPANGVDENGLAGDLPRAAASLPERRSSPAPWQNRPPVILFVLESVRADVVGSFFNGRRVTPVLDSLASQGVKVESAWSHNGFTGQSRYHILTGKLPSGRGNDTILDDFKAHGYEVAYFSGQDDDFGDVGLLRHGVDTYYDARHDLDKRYTSSATPGSLAVPHDVVETRIRNHLSSRRDDAPLFLYVNFHDTHYPYNHPGLENLIGGELLPASLISPGRRHDLLRTYLNATANVDRAIGRVIDTVERQLRQRPAVIVIGDHGESLFDQGFLGHGYALNDAQTRIPFIVRGLPVRVTMPFGQADLRKAVNESLAGRDINDRPLAVADRSSRVFQYLGRLESTPQIGWMTTDGSFTYDLRSDRVNVWDAFMKPSLLAGEPRKVFMDLVHTWERLLLANAPEKGGTN